MKRTGPSATATIAFATEAPGEPQVATGLHYRLTGRGIMPADHPPPDVNALYSKHRQAVAERAFSGDGRVLPEIGKEHEWLHERAAKVARHFAEQHGMVQMGEFYRVPWRSCAWQALKWLGQKLNPWRKRPQPKAQA